MVPSSEVCVQPKVRTSQVGCTVRSLSHHLALLPAKGEITTRWLYAAPGSSTNEKALNLLVVPFPYRIDGNAFAPDSKVALARFFSLRQTWLSWNNRRIRPRAISRFLRELVNYAGSEVQRVHGLVLPELALDGTNIVEIAEELARTTDLELFVSGIFIDSRRIHPYPLNKVFSAIFQRGRILTSWEQAKHHRWRLDGDQVRRYQLGDALDPTHLWWEKIALESRECTLSVFRHGASVATLVCEDLARIDPVQTALRAVGPNLVIVLLMDGPQFEKRWPGRYATILADDPGSAVLTLTSLGMVQRSTFPGEEERREIGLWKETASMAARELKLDAGRRRAKKSQPGKRKPEGGTGAPPSGSVACAQAEACGMSRHEPGSSVKTCATLPFALSGVSAPYSAV